MARAGLGTGWKCRFANDISSKKSASYAANWGATHLKVGDVAHITLEDLAGHVDLAWASFPCQDLSLAGSQAGLGGARSGTFWPFWQLMRHLTAAQRAPRMIVLENVYGLLTASGGQDFAALADAITALNYRLGAVVMDAVHFVPQSRPRLFILAIAPGIAIPDNVTRSDPSALWHPRSLVEAKFKLSKATQDKWLWWDMPAPSSRTLTFADVIETNPADVKWNSPTETQKLLEMMSPVNQQKVQLAQRAGIRCVGALYRRTRNGVQRAEIRFDDVAGCLRTPRGGSSRQSIMVVEGHQIRSRLLSAREAARLMGLPNKYVLPANYNDAYHLVGDGLVVPVVSHLATQILNPIVAANQAAQSAIAA